MGFLLSINNNMSKGSNRRKPQITDDAFSDAWDLIFNDKAKDTEGQADVQLSEAPLEVDKRSKEK